ncbi:MAG: ComEC/Rec2 family competence protein [Candidatus Dependentiae bacterium]
MSWSFFKSIFYSFILIDFHGLTFCTFSFIMGIATQFFGYNHLIISAFLISIFFLLHNKINCILLLSFISFICGAHILQMHTNYHNALSEFYGKKISLQGHITNIETTKNNYFPTKITLKIHTIFYNNKNHKKSHTLYLYVSANEGNDVGDEIKVKNIVLTPQSKNSYEQYLHKEGISKSIFAQHNSIKLIKPPVYSLNRYIHQLRNQLLFKISQLIGPESQGIVNTLFLGNRNSETDTIKNSFKYWGISHYLARSGLHLIMLIIVWQFLLSFLPLPFFLKEIIITILVLIYSIFSWASISFNRALCMFVLIKTSFFLKRPVHYMHLICLTALVILIHNPFQLFFLDFQLSFGLTFAIAWFNHLLFLKEQQIT